MTETHSSWVDEQTWKARWEIVEKLDGGGQGEAFRARRRSDGKIGFLKVIKSKNVAERRARFFREATAYDSFGIDGIPRLIESNAHRHADDRVAPYIVTEFIVGITLRSWLESQASVSIETAVTITSRLLDILQACHAQGCVHRDVKPDNIILEGGNSERVWLLDFGISYHDLADIDFQTEHWQEVGNRFLRLPECQQAAYRNRIPGRTSALLRASFSICSQATILMCLKIARADCHTSERARLRRSSMQLRPDSLGSLLFSTRLLPLAYPTASPACKRCVNEWTGLCKINHLNHRRTRT